MDTANRLRVLSRQCGYNARTVDVESAEGFDIGLNASTAAGIGTSDSQSNRSSIRVCQLRGRARIFVHPLLRWI